MTLALTNERKQQAGSTFLVVLGCIIGGASARHVVAPTEPLIGRVTGFLAICGIAIPLFAGGLWMRKKNTDDSDVARILGWSSAGMAPLAVFTVLIIYYQRQHGVTLAEPFIVGLWVIGVGAVGGFLTGMYSVRMQTEQRRYRTLLDHSNDSIFIVDVDTGTFVDVNETACQKLGYNREELLEQSVTDIETTLSTEAEWHAHVETVREEGTILYEGEQQCKDGSTFPVEVNIAYVAHDQEYTIAIARDITERKERERELKRFHEAIEHAGHAIYITDTDGTIEYANPAFEDITGYAPDEAVGNDPSILQSGEHDNEYYRRLWNTILDGQVWEEEIVNQRKSGELYTARQTIAPILDDGTIVGFVAIQSDVTTQRVREQQISVLNRILRHNLRTAVNVISGHANLLLEEVEEEHQTHANQIKKQARELETLSEEAHTVRKALDNTQPPARSVPVSDILNQVVEPLEDAHPSANITIENSVPDSILIDASIKVALDELVRNAIVHSDQSHPSVQIIVTVKQDTEQVSITVADDGPGIPTQERATLRDGDETPLQHGNSIGLWLVKWVTTALGGKVDIDDNEPRGSVVTLTLPVISPSDDATVEYSITDSSKRQRSNKHTPNDD